MLFNSFTFIFLFFLPLFVILRFSYKYLSKVTILWILIIASLIFYGDWNYKNLWIILSSIFVNFFIAKNSFKSPKIYLIVAIIFNLALLGFFKYTYFFLSIFNIRVDWQISLPLAISFFTFQQIAFQVDLYKKSIKIESFREYLFFVLFFPQLIAGPIVHYREIIGQIKRGSFINPPLIYIQNGIFLFSVGLFKKVFIADTISTFTTPLYNSISESSSLDLLIGLFAYSFKIYFDFSGYVDMALGLALMLGFVLPINFNSPYKSYDIVDFWRRWHITLSNFLRDYLYIPLGGSREGRLKTFRNLMITMLLGGLWHGAGWGFIIWGFFHGLFLSINHYLKEKFLFFKQKRIKIIFVPLTFIIVSLLWVLFKANSFEEALLYYKGLSHLKMDTQILKSWIDNHFELSLLLSFSLFTTWFLPNSNQLANSNRYMDLKAILAGLFFIISLKIMLGSPSQEFIYFKF